MQLVDKLTAKLFRTFIFTKKLREMLLRTLSLQIRKRTSPLDFFTMLSESTDDLTLRSLSKTAIASLNSGRAFATDLADEMYFTEDDARLLCAAERTGTLPEVIDLLLEKEDKETNFMKVVVFGNISWILALTLLIAITMAGRTYEKLASSISGGTRADFFILGEFLDANIIYIVGSLLFVLASYLIARTMILGNARNQLKEVGIFKFHDMKSSANICRLFAAVCRTNNISPMDMLRLGRDVSKDNRFLSYSLEKAMDDLSHGADPVDAIGTHLLSKMSALQLKMMTPKKLAEEMANAFEAIAENTQEETKWVLSSMSQVTGYVLMTTTLLMAYPLMEISMGATITV